jgi:hypothetical protein
VTQAVFRRRGRTLVPVDRQGLDLLATIGNERDVVVEVKARRNPKHHRLLFAILKIMVDHSASFDSTEQALVALKIATGEVDVHVNERGRAFFVPRSISWGAMDQARFSQFFDRAIYVITRRWMPAGTQEADVRAEIEAMVAPPDGRDAA